MAVRHSSKEERYIKESFLEVESNFLGSRGKFGEIACMILSDTAHLLCPRFSVYFQIHAVTAGRVVVSSCFR